MVEAMTENKRFELCVDSNNQKSLWDNKKEDGEPLLCLNRFDEIIGIDEVYDLLNEQEEIITEQKEFLTRMGQGNHLKTIMEQKERIKELEQENKRLKQGKYIYGIHGGSNDWKYNVYLWIKYGNGISQRNGYNR